MGVKDAMRRPFDYVILTTIAALFISCAPESSNISPTERCPEQANSMRSRSQCPLLTRAAGQNYGLPRNGLQSIADLIDVLPEADIGRDEPKFYSSSAQGLMCTNGRTSQSASLPMTIEGVITIPGTYYIKVSVCDQEEKFYGSFVVEDDTGGIMVLRDSRVSQVQPGDVVRMTVHSMAVSDNLGRIDSRAILSYDLEIRVRKEMFYMSERPTHWGPNMSGEQCKSKAIPSKNPLILTFQRWS